MISSICDFRGKSVEEKSLMMESLNGEQLYNLSPSVFLIFFVNDHHKTESVIVYKSDSRKKTLKNIKKLEQQSNFIKWDTILASTKIVNYIKSWNS